MISDLVPGLKQLTREQKSLLVWELEQELADDDPTMHEPLGSEIIRVLEARRQHYLAHPESALTLEQVSQKMRSLKGR